MLKEFDRILKAAKLLAAISIIPCGLLWWRHSEPRPLPKLGQINPFHFMAQDGQFFDSLRLEGKVWVADFFYSTCHSSCPLQTAYMSELQKQWKNRDDLNLVSFTLDPKNDTPKVLTAYAKNYGADTSKWFFLTGEKEDIYRLAQTQFKVTAQEDDSGDEPDFIHSTRLVLVDRAGYIRGYYSVLDPKELDLLKSDLTQLLSSIDKVN